MSVQRKFGLVTTASLINQLKGQLITAASFSDQRQFGPITFASLIGQHQDELFTDTSLNDQHQGEGHDGRNDEEC